MELIDVVRSVRRHWRISLAVLLACVALLAVFLVTRNEIRGEDLHKASVQVLIPARNDEGERPEGVPPSLLQGQQQLANAQRVRTLDGATDVVLGVTVNEDGDIMTLSATAPAVDQARLFAEKFAANFISARRTLVASQEQQAKRAAVAGLQRVQDEIARVEGELTALDVDFPPIVQSPGNEIPGRTAGEPATIDIPEGTPLEAEVLLYERNDLYNRRRDLLRTQAAAGTQAVNPSSHATIVERPAPTLATPEAPSPLIPIAIAVGLGLALALALPVLLDRMDDSINDAKAATAAFAAPVLTSIPAMSRHERFALAEPGTPSDGAFRALAATSVATNRLPRAIMVTSPTGNVQDSVAANFAAALSSLGLRVVLVATTPKQSWFAPGSNGSGRNQVTLPHLLELAHGGRLNGEVRYGLTPTSVPNLLVVPPGETDDLELSLDGLPPLLAALQAEDVDVTVIAGQPLLEDPNATIFAWATRCVLWAVETGEVTEAQAKEAAARLELADVTSFGVAMVGRS